MAKKKSKKKAGRNTDDPISDRIRRKRVRMLPLTPESPEVQAVSVCNRGALRLVYRECRTDESQFYELELGVPHASDLRLCTSSIIISYQRKELVNGKWASVEVWRSALVSPHDPLLADVLLGLGIKSSDGLGWGRHKDNRKFTQAVNRMIKRFLEEPEG